MHPIHMLLAVAVAVTPGAADGENPISQPPIEPHEALFYHADALAAELDGDLAQALALLRRAHGATPSDESIAFDLTRLARENPEPAQPGDAEAVLQVEPTSSATRLLQAYVHIERGEIGKARERISEVLSSEPEHTEAATLASTLEIEPTTPVVSKTREPTQQKASWAESHLAARVRVSGQFDSNVTVLPDDSPSREVGWRTLVEAGVVALLLEKPLRLDVAAFAQYGPHVIQRDELGYYDVAAGVLLAMLEKQLGPVLVKLDLIFTEVLLDSFQAQFMQDGGGRIEGIYPVGPLEIGLFGRGGYRNFLEGNMEGESGDRDGGYVGGGLLVQWRLHELRVTGRGGYSVEFSQGDEMHQHGPQAKLNARYDLSALSVSAGATYTWRNFARSVAERRDHQISLRAGAAYAIWEFLAVRGGYTWVRNLSEDVYDYERHVAQLGLEARY